MSRKKQIKISKNKQIELDIICESLTGNEIEIIDSDNKNQIGIKGLLVFESANLFYIKVDSSIKKILKKGTLFIFEAKEGKYKVNGDLLLNSIISRIKKIK